MVQICTGIFIANRNIRSNKFCSGTWTLKKNELVLMLHLFEHNFALEFMTICWFTFYFVTRISTTVMYIFEKSVTTYKCNSFSNITCYFSNLPQWVSHSYHSKSSVSVITISWIKLFSLSLPELLLLTLSPSYFTFLFVTRSVTHE